MQKIAEFQLPMNLGTALWSILENWNTIGNFQHSANNRNLKIMEKFKLYRIWNEIYQKFPIDVIFLMTQLIIIKFFHIYSLSSFTMIKLLFRPLPHIVIKKMCVTHLTTWHLSSKFKFPRKYILTVLKQYLQTSSADYI